ncbi:MAG: hypothetical protein ACJ789_01405 [Thermomicrobiales bacterium]
MVLLVILLVAALAGSIVSSALFDLAAFIVTPPNERPERAARGNRVD